MKISKKQLNKLVDERVERHLRRFRKNEQALKKQLEEVRVLMDDLPEYPRSSGSRQRFEEYED